MCHRPSEPSADRARTVSVARRPTAWSCCGTVKSSSAVRNQSFAGPETDAAVPTRRRCPGTVGTGVPARRPEPSAHGGRCSSAAGTFNQNTQRRLLVRADVPSWWLSPLQQHNTTSLPPPRSSPGPCASGTPLRWPRSTRSMPSPSVGARVGFYPWPLSLNARPTMHPTTLGNLRIAINSCFPASPRRH